MTNDANKLHDYYAATDRLELAAMVAKDARRVDEGYRTSLERDIDALNRAAAIKRTAADVAWWERQARDLRAWGLPSQHAEEAYARALVAAEEAKAGR